MKARVKATGLVSEVCPYSTIYLEGVDNCFYPDEVEIVDTISDSPDYWTRLKHQYAGMAMQGIMRYVEQITPKKGRSFCDEIVDISFNVAHALVERMKNKEE